MAAAPRGNANPSSGHQITAREREGRILELRKSGMSFDAIAKALGMSSRGRAFEAYKRAIDRIVTTPAKELLALENERLDALQRACWANALRGDYGAIDRSLRIMERRARLNGLDAPQRVDLGIPEVDLDAAFRDVLSAVSDLAREREDTLTAPTVIDGELAPQLEG